MSSKPTKEPFEAIDNMDLEKFMCYIIRKKLVTPEIVREIYRYIPLSNKANCY